MPDGAGPGPTITVLLHAHLRHHNGGQERLVLAHRPGATVADYIAALGVPGHEFMGIVTAPRRGSVARWTASSGANPPDLLIARWRRSRQNLRTMEHVTTIGERLEQVPAVVFALLFGSRATGRHSPRSDLDLAVYAEDSLSPRQRFDLRLKIVNAVCDLGKPDVVMLNDAPPLLAHRALAGTLLVNRDHARYVRFFIRTVAASEDERHWREVHARARRRRMEEGRFGRP